MNAKRILSLFLAAVLTLGVAVTPAVAASAAPALPGSAALEAAMNPNETDYYFYALGTDGRHHFSRTLAEHNAFVGSSSYGG